MKVLFTLAVAFTTSACVSTISHYSTAPSTPALATEQTQIPTATQARTPMQPPTGSPLASDVAAILNGHGLELGPLPRGHAPLVDRDAAIAKVMALYNVTERVVYLAHGTSRVDGSLGETVWLFIAKIPEMEPMPVGPGCPSPPNGCEQIWAVNDYLVQFVSDQTGEQVPGGFTTMREVPAPLSPLNSGRLTTVAFVTRNVSGSSLGRPQSPETRWSSPHDPWAVDRRCRDGRAGCRLRVLRRQRLAVRRAPVC